MQSLLCRTIALPLPLSNRGRSPGALGRRRWARSLPALTSEWLPGVRFGAPLRICESSCGARDRVPPISGPLRRQRAEVAGGKGFVAVSREVEVAVHQGDLHGGPPFAQGAETVTGCTPRASARAHPHGDRLHHHAGRHRGLLRTGSAPGDAGSSSRAWTACATTHGLASAEGHRCRHRAGHCAFLRVATDRVTGWSPATHEAPVPLREIFDVSTQQRRSLVGSLSCRTRPTGRLWLSG